jgi:hypothetical protein
MWTGRMAGLVVGGLAVLIPGCNFDAPFKWSTRVHTEVAIPDGEEFKVLDFQLGEPFEINGGKIAGKLKTHLGAADAMAAPPSLDWRVLWLNSDGSQTKGTYSTTAQGKMHRAGSSSYNLTYVFQDSAVPTWDLVPTDRLRMVVHPTGGSINAGWDIKTTYAWTPHP